MTNELSDYIESLDALEKAYAREDLNVYAGLHIPQQIETDEISGNLVIPDKNTVAERYVPADHHRLINQKLMELEAGAVVDGRPLDRLMIFAPPGSAKSTYASVLFPAWYHGRHPTHDILGASQTTELAERFGRRVRNLVGSEIHREIFGSGLAKDQRAAGAWTTDRGGEYKAVSTAPFAGRRGDLALLDDLIRGQKDADSPTIRESIWQWLLSDLYPRLKPNAKLVYIMTRWHQDDPAGRMLPDSWNGQSGWFEAKDGEWWYVLSFVAIVETPEEAECDPLKRAIGDIIWPQWFNFKMLNQMRRKLGQRAWNALYQQKPRDDEGGILKRQYWRKWTGEKLPKVEYVISVYDTAMEEGEENDYSARTSWGVFWHEEPPKQSLEPRKPWQPQPVGGRHCAILLEAWQDKVDFPKLRKLSKEHYDELQPDRVLVEKKVSGISLIQELRRAGVPVKGIPADKSKKARAHAAAVVLEDGCIFYPDRRWAEDVIERCANATFIKGDPGNDMADTAVHAWNFLRKTFHLQTSDEDDDEPEETAKPTAIFGG
jgi:predicted phage terminase large subunit-like protein